MKAYFKAKNSFAAEVTFNKKKTLWTLFMGGVQLLQDYRATSRRQFTFYH